jgi:hypothetical protein
MSPQGFNGQSPPWDGRSFASQPAWMGREPVYGSFSWFSDSGGSISTLEKHQTAKPQTKLSERTSITQPSGFMAQLSLGERLVVINIEPHPPPAYFTNPQANNQYDGYSDN